MDSSECPMWDLEDIKLQWQDPDLNTNIVFPLGITFFFRVQESMAQEMD